MWSLWSLEFSRDKPAQNNKKKFFKLSHTLYHLWFPGVKQQFNLNGNIIYCFLCIVAVFKDKFGGKIRYLKKYLNSRKGIHERVDIFCITTKRLLSHKMRNKSPHLHNTHWELNFTRVTISTLDKLISDSIPAYL